MNRYHGKGFKFNTSVDTMQSVSFWCLYSRGVDTIEPIYKLSAAGISLHIQTATSQTALPNPQCAGLQCAHLYSLMLSGGSS